MNGSDSINQNFTWLSKSLNMYRSDKYCRRGRQEIYRNRSYVCTVSAAKYFGLRDNLKKFRQHVTTRCLYFCISLPLFWILCTWPACYTASGWIHYFGNRFKYIKSLVHPNRICCVCVCVCVNWNSKPVARVETRFANSARMSLWATLSLSVYVTGHTTAGGF